MLHIRMYIHTYVHTYIHITYVHAYVHTCIHTYVHTFVYTYVYAYVHTNVCMEVICSTCVHRCNGCSIVPSSPYLDCLLKCTQFTCAESCSFPTPLQSSALLVVHQAVGL